MPVKGKNTRTAVWDEENERWWPRTSIRGKELAAIQRKKKEEAKEKELASKEAKYGIRMADCHPDKKHYIGGKCRACHEYKLYHGVDKPLENAEPPTSPGPQPVPDSATPPGPGREPTLQEKIAKLKQLGMEDLLFFGKNIMGYSLLNEEEHRELADFLMSPRKQFSVVAAPRDTLKTTLCSIVYPTWRMARGETGLRVMLDSETRSNAQARLRNIQDKMIGQWQMRTCFGDWNGKSKGLTWNDEEFNIAQRTDFSAKECNFEASGIDVVRNSRHYNLIIPDDLHSEKNSQTKDQIQNVVEHIRCLFPLLEEGGEMLFVCTFWDDNDAIRQIMEMMKDEVSIFIRSAYKEDGSVRYPNRLPENRLKSARKLMGNYLYSCQFLLDPVPKDSATFREENILSIPRHKVPRSLRKFVLVDPAGDPTATTEAKKDSDNYAMGAIAVSPTGNIYLLDAVLGVMTPTEANENMIRLMLAYNPHVSGIEKTGLGNMKHYVSEEMRKRGKFALIDDLMPGGRSKYQRISALEPVVKLRKFYIVDDCPFRDEIVNEFVRFPKAKKDDATDMIAYIMDMITKYGTSIVESETDDQEEMDARLSGLDDRSRTYWEKFHGAEKKKRDENWVGEFV